MTRAFRTSCGFLARPWVAPALAVLLVVAILSPVRASALRFDDSRVITENRGQRIAQDVSVLSLVERNVRSMVEGQGRPQPLGVVEGTLLATALPDRLAYKAVLAILTAISLALLLVLLRELGISTRSLPFAAVAFGLVLQFRAYHDPVLGYYGTTQVSFITLALGLLAYLRFIRGASKSWYVIAIVSTAALLALYEVNYPLVLAFPALHLGRDVRRKRGYGWSVPVLGLGAGMFVLAAYTHSTAAVVATGYETSLDLLAAVQAALRQFFAPFPAIYFISGGGGLLDAPTKAEILAAGWRAGVALVLFLALILGVRRRTSEQTVEAAPGDASATPQLAAVAAIGVVLIVGSVLLLSLAAKYQTEIPLGGGYLPTLLQVLGMTALACAAWVKWGAALAGSTVAIVLVAGGVAGATFVNQYSNLRVIAADFPGLQQRELLLGGLEHGALDGLERDTTIYYLDRDLNWPRGNLVSVADTLDYYVLLHARRRADIRPVAAVAAACPSSVTFPIPDCSPVERSVDWLLVRGHRFGGSVIHAEASAGSAATPAQGATARKIVVTARGTSARGPLPTVAGLSKAGRVWTARDIPWKRTRRGGGWVRYEGVAAASSAPIASTLIDPLASVDFTQPEVGGQSARLFGTKRLLP